MHKKKCTGYIWTWQTLVSEVFFSEKKYASGNWTLCKGAPLRSTSLVPPINELIFFSEKTPREPICVNTNRICEAVLSVPYFVVKFTKNDLTYFR